MSDQNINDDTYQPCWVGIGDEYILWKGTWNSTNFDSVYGTIEVPLMKNNNNNNNGKYEVNAIITYDGIYNSGKKVIFPITVTSTEIESLNKREVTYLEFVGYIGNQKIKYSISNYKSDKITGIYKSFKPNDVGNIELETTEDRKIDYGPKQSVCVIV